MSHAASIQGNPWREIQENLNAVFRFDENEWEIPTHKLEPGENAPQWLKETLDWVLTLEANAPSFNCEWLVDQFKAHSISWLKCGLVAWQAKINRLYTQMRYGNFKDFCELALGKSPWYVNRIIEASRVVVDLLKAGFTHVPQNEAQARPLVKFHGEELAQKWGEVLASFAPQHITASKIEEIVSNKPEAMTRNIKVSRDIYEKFAAKARLHGINPEELIQDFMESFDPDPDDLDDYDGENEDDDDTVTEITRNALETWENDLKLLIEEHDQVQESQALPNSS